MDFICFAPKVWVAIKMFQKQVFAENLVSPPKASDRNKTRPTSVLWVGGEADCRAA
jgi:hypothetical protein